MQLVKWIKEERKAASPSSAPTRSTTAPFILIKEGLTAPSLWSVNPILGVDQFFSFN